MDSPIFKLEKVVQTKTGEVLEDFEGPLDLILFLLSKNKIEIQDIPIALILDQYLAYLEQRQQMDLEVASEFITMAAHLMYIKTRMLLSIEDEEAQSEMDALIKSLEERKRGETYLRIKQLAQRLEPLGEFGRNVLTRDPEPMERGKIYEYRQEPGDLVIAMQEVLDRQAPPAAAPEQAFREIVKREPYSVEPFDPRPRHPVFAAVPGQPQPQRTGSYLHGGAGTVPQPHDPSGRTQRRLYRQLGAGRAGTGGEDIRDGTSGNERDRGGRREHSLRLRRTGGGRADLYGPGAGPQHRGAGTAEAGGLLQL